MRRSLCPSVKRARALAMAEAKEASPAKMAKVENVTLKTPLVGTPVKSVRDAGLVTAVDKEMAGGNAMPALTPAFPPSVESKPDDAAPIVLAASSPSQNSLVTDYGAVVADLETQNSDKILELKKLLRHSEENLCSTKDVVAIETFGDSSLAGSTDIEGPDTSPERLTRPVISDADTANVDDECITSASTSPDRRRQLLQAELSRLRTEEAGVDVSLVAAEEKKRERERKAAVEKDRVRIRRLHEYNDIKDACQVVFGRIAEIDGVTVKDVYGRYELQLDD